MLYVYLPSSRTDTLALQQQQYMPFSVRTVRVSEPPPYTLSIKPLLITAWTITTANAKSDSFRVSRYYIYIILITI